ncbi:50S ribosomal protein L9 [Phycisphaera mikurensis]|uniref:Large ribosomal subunit protein bL9 n=1 Tax=Phycisphaera mikurensis (strain NBRC 102666 / KCTC 22515 / FYK2301M01) TaxID=1142394 RepID=I0IET7_PHYMF|nr:50S ribosomal protein L9 [Phycisphaera mikurensis]MBB6441570.1 large subunit ribosomal protein L9 [Phycisphaera mikurensis]BAM03775.1 50S ribosomal protein L9 [Phycisphaera mikurensis NBRC 102666]
MANRRTDHTQTRTGKPRSGHQQPATRGRQHDLLMLETLENVGIVGDVVRVKAGFARNYLLPRGIAEVPTQEKIEELAGQRAEAEAEQKRIRGEQEAMIAKLDGHELTVERSTNDQGVLFGGITQHEVAEMLREEGFAIEDRYVRLGQVAKRVDTYDVPIVINRDLKCEIKLNVKSDAPEEEVVEEDEAEGEDEGPRFNFYVPKEANVESEY